MEIESSDGCTDGRIRDTGVTTEALSALQYTSLLACLPLGAGYCTNRGAKEVFYSTGFSAETNPEDLPPFKGSRLGAGSA
ncbi:hypothetical protein MPTK1_1g09430 [Marchantia polymorpha subsp. ruderalis]|uniref:Uncharacterized protein n=2 Tax=Marchantia polymorpha TaxID=3197 RepID=A0AAF6AN97_MARPO|nr:hypothetical protein MARPO_0096s0057 [Marchantia polymorpha]BBM97917.1 hypothetical protein Mp_1g09430 [Marchantia polymorpha subsp. ruderalis]|eukprot:PTQ32712.1 hypothetical protein MARPO_0096s0057 [Marchantia polymorpha]